ncbi:hypothetical protein [Halobacillus sp. B29]|uniref:hypothetical protein n=1 Tax=Halobacillus sp. B29 TaxID=3457432 RepID=UPI003FCD914C
MTFVVASHESLIGGCLPRARAQLTWSRRPLDQVDLRLALFPQASPPNAHRGSNGDPSKKNAFLELTKVNHSTTIRETNEEVEGISLLLCRKIIVGLVGK